MNRMRTFARGGIHPPEKKNLTADCPIHDAPLPAIAVVPFAQHIGAPSKPLVLPDDHVEEGQLIAESEGFISSSVHSPIPGMVKEIRNLYLPNGVQCDAAVIERDERIPRRDDFGHKRDWSVLSNDEILDLLRLHGVVGQGGATFPAHVKFTIPKGRECAVFLVNAAECEPYLSVDHRLMLERGEALIEGIRIVRKLLCPQRVLIGIEANKGNAIQSLKATVASENIEVVPLKVKYPQGAEKNLIEAALGIMVPSGRLPIEVGVINANVGTLISVCEAVRDNRPVIDRVITVAGDAITKPGNIRARIGTSVGDIIEECGGLRENPLKLISGGPLMGFAFGSLDTPISKGTCGILALTAREVKSASPTACLSCGRCIDACPMGLIPTLIFKNIEHELMNEAVGLGLDDCVLCGACAYACPSHIPLVSAFKAARGRRRRLAARTRG